MRETKDSASEEETKSDSDEDVVFEGILIGENKEEEKQKSIRCRCYVGCFVLWALLIYLLTDYYFSRIYITY